MSFYYYSGHKRTKHINVPYQFNCEHCGQNSGRLNAEISGVVEHSRKYEKLSEQKAAEIDQRASQRLMQTYYETKANTEKGIFGFQFKDKCPHCGRPQSWKLSDMGGTNYLLYGFIGAVAGGVIGFQLAPALISYSAMIGMVVAGFCAGVIFTFIQVSNKKAKTKYGHKEVPTIHWPE